MEGLLNVKNLKTNKNATKQGLQGTSM